MSLTIPQHVENGDYDRAKENAFRDACLVWNAVDQSGKRRIQVPEQHVKVQMVPVIKSKAMSHTESDSDSDASTHPRDDWAITEW